MLSDVWCLLKFLLSKENDSDTQDYTYGYVYIHVFYKKLCVINPWKTFKVQITIYYSFSFTDSVWKKRTQVTSPPLSIDIPLSSFCNCNIFVCTLIFKFRLKIHNRINEVKMSTLQETGKTYLSLCLWFKTNRNIHRPLSRDSLMSSHRNPKETSVQICFFMIWYLSMMFTNSYWLMRKSVWGEG